MIALPACENRNRDIATTSGVGKMTEFLGGAASAAKIGALASFGGMVWAMALSPDNLPVLGGLALGIGGLGWSVYLSGRDRRASTLTQEIELLQSIVKSVRVELAEAQERAKKLVIENEVLSARVARLESEDGDRDQVPA